MSTSDAEVRHSAASQKQPEPAREPAAGTAALWRETLRTGLVGGAVASLASTLALAWCGRLETGSGSAATNATSQWLWGRKALAARRPSWRHTAIGYAIHHGTATFWAVLHARLHARRPPAASPGAALARAAATAGTAFAIDYTITPRRLRPGFEHHLSSRAMAIVYASFALGLACGCAVAERGRRR